MPSHQKNPAEHQQEQELESVPNRPRTRAKNATHRPGADAEKTLRVRRDPAVVQKEKEARQSRKEEKERERQEEAASEKEASSFLEGYRAQQMATMEDEEASIPRHKSQGTEYFIFSG